LDYVRFWLQLRRDSIQVPNHDGLKYDETTGIIAPGLFGIGFAFPKGKSDKVGNYEYDLGLWKFMTDLENVLPLWFHDSSNLGLSNKEYCINLSVGNNVDNQD
jgi:hypothetical protein